MSDKPEVTFTSVFVDEIPEELEDNTLYVSLLYETSSHKCACGCGREVALPFWGENHWKLTMDGELVTFSPSIGNRFPCKSHYFIKDNKVQWA